MAKLFWLQPDNTIVEFPLKAEQNLIGRSSRCDVRIKHPGISAEHALIRLLPGAATVEDLNSTNGTRVNGRRVESHTLRHGDQIGVGRERLMYFAELDEASRFAQPQSIEPFAQPAPGGETVNTDNDVIRDAGKVVAAVAAQVFVYSLAVHWFWESYAPYLIEPKMANTAKVSDEEVKYTVTAEGYIKELSKSVVGGIEEGVEAYLHKVRTYPGNLRRIS